MKEKDIRPNDLMNKQKELYLEDVNNFILFKNEFEEQDCPACSARDNFRIIEKFSLSYSRCNKCRTVYMNPGPKKQHLEHYYSNSKNYQYWAENIFPRSEFVRRNKIFIPRVNSVIDECARRGFKKPTMLEIGAGFGLFCEEAHKKNFFKNIVGIEPTPWLAQICKNKGFEVVEDFFENFLSNDKFEVIACFEVIEHILNPLDFLKRVDSYLSDDGFLYFTCPNFEGFDVLCLQERSDQIDTEHINMFNPTSIAILLNRAGFVLESVTTPGLLDVDIVSNKIESGAFDFSSNMFLKHIFEQANEKVLNNFQKFLQENCLSSNMQIIAKKNR